MSYGVHSVGITVFVAAISVCSMAQATPASQATLEMLAEQVAQLDAIGTFCALNMQILHTAYQSVVTAAGSIRPNHSVLKKVYAQSFRSETQRIQGVAREQNYTQGACPADKLTVLDQQLPVAVGALNQISAAWVSAGAANNSVAQPSSASATNPSSVGSQTPAVAGGVPSSKSASQSGSAPQGASSSQRTLSSQSAPESSDKAPVSGTQSIPTGKYSCYTFDAGQLNYAYTDVIIESGQRYRVGSQHGTYQLKEGRVTFTGHLSNAQARYSVKNTGVSQLDLVFNNDPRASMACSRAR